MLLCKRTLIGSKSIIKNEGYLTIRHSSSSCDYSVKEKKKEEKTRRPSRQGTFIINIPEKELAHNTFFSLHRPLLDLPSKRPIFSTYSIEEEQEMEMSRRLSQHMSKLEHFVEPGTENISKESNTLEIQEVLYSPLPVFRMPDSSDILDFLSTVETKMNAENEKKNGKAIKKPTRHK